MIDLSEINSILLDVNALAIGLTSNHPGHAYIIPFFEECIKGRFDLLVFDYLPFRAQYLMEKKFDVSKIDARNSIQSFLRCPIDIISAKKETLLNSYEISAEKNHDVYDCFYISLARKQNADAILTTDADFERLCKIEDFSYLNPVPKSVIKRFRSV